MVHGGSAFIEANRSLAITVQSPSHLDRAGQHETANLVPQRQLADVVQANDVIRKQFLHEVVFIRRSREMDHGIAAGHGRVHRLRIGQVADPIVVHPG